MWIAIAATTEFKLRYITWWFLKLMLGDDKWQVIKYEQL